MLDFLRHPSADLLKLLLDVRLTFLPYDFLNDVIERQSPPSLLREDDECLREVKIARDYHKTFPDKRLVFRKKREPPNDRLQLQEKYFIDGDMLRGRVFLGERCKPRRSIGESTTGFNYFFLGGGVSFCEIWLRHRRPEGTAVWHYR